METATFIFGFIFFLNLWRHSNELKCYRCLEASDFCNEPEKIDCPPDKDKCFSYRFPGTKDEPKYEERGCISSKKEPSIRQSVCKANVKCDTCSKDLCNKDESSPTSEPANNTGPKIGPSLFLLSVLMAFLLFSKFSFFD